MIKKLLLLRTNRVWRLWAELVHYTLFFELLRHELSASLTILLKATERIIEAHGALLAMSLGALISVLNIYLAHGKKKKGARSKASSKKKQKAAQQRDRYGRFVRADSRAQEKSKELQKES